MHGCSMDLLYNFHKIAEKLYEKGGKVIEKVFRSRIVVRIYLWTSAKITGLKDDTPIKKDGQTKYTYPFYLCKGASTMHKISVIQGMKSHFTCIGYPVKYTMTCV